jgi:phage baseplate assembly protein W
MASGLSVKLPLVVDPREGHLMNKTILEVVRQNLEMLIRTAPGERMMDLNFGVGLRHWLFRLMNNTTYEEIATEMRAQIARYMPFIDFKGVLFETNEQDPLLPLNQLRMKVQYRVVAIGIPDQIELTVGVAHTPVPVKLGETDTL